MLLVSKLRPYGLAAIFCGLALATARAFDAPSAFFLLAVIASSVYGGNGPALFSVVVCAVAYRLFSPPPSIVQFAAFVGATLLVAWLIESKRRAEDLASKSPPTWRRANLTRRTRRH